MINDIFNPSSYSQNIYVLPPLLTALIILSVTLLVLYKERITRISIAFSFVTITIGWWLFCFSMVYFSSDENIAGWWVKLSYISIPFIATAAFNFIVISLDIYQRYKKQLLTSLILSFVFSVLAFSNKAFLVGMKSYWWGYYPQYGWLGYVFFVFFSSILIGSFLICLIEYRRIPHGLKKLRTKSFIIAFVISVVGIVDFLPKFGIMIYPFGYIPLLIFIFICARTVWVYSLEDITPAFVANKVFNSIEDALLLIDREGVIRIANRNAEKIFHKSAGKLIEKPIKTLIDNNLFLEKYEELLRSSENQNFEISYAGDEGSSTLSVSISLILDQTKQSHAIICIFRDITDIKQSQLLLLHSEKLAAIGKLTAGLAHELNSPLSGIIALINAYRKNKGKDSKEYKQLMLMHEACEHMAKIVKDFVSFSRKSDQEYAEIDINEMIEGVLDLISPTTKLEYIEIIKKYSLTLPKINGDKAELQQVVLNLFTNAIDAMEARAKDRRFIIKTGVSQDNNKLLIEIIDNGCGIDKEDIKKIFDPFFTTKKQGKGAGLGLSVSYGIIRSHEGEMTVESEPGRGSKFTILLPMME